MLSSLNAELNLVSVASVLVNNRGQGLSSSVAFPEVVSVLVRNVLFSSQTYWFITETDAQTIYDPGPIGE